MRERSIPKIIISHLAGILLFLVLIILLNGFVTTDNMMVKDIIMFLNSNIALIIILSIIFMIADIIYALMIPLSLPAPLFSAIGSMLVVMFIYRILGLIDVILNTDMLSALIWTRWLFYPVVFIVVLITGFISIFLRPVMRIGETRPRREKIIDITMKKKKSWNDVGDEFKEMLYDLLHSWRKSIKK